MHYPVMTERQVAARWKLSLKTLRRWRLDKEGPIWHKLFHHVRYHETAIFEFERQSAQHWMSILGDGERVPRAVTHPPKNADDLTCRVIFGPLDSWDDGFLRAGGSDEEGTIFGRADGSDPAGSRCGDGGRDGQEARYFRADDIPLAHSIVARPSKCLTSQILSHFIMAIYRQIDRQSIPLTEGGRR